MINLAGRRRNGWHAQSRVGRRLGERGQALVEVAIALPILLALLVGIFEFARAYNIQQVITNAAREGARRGVVPDGNQTNSTAVVTNRLSNANVTATSITYSCTGACATADTLTITVDVDYTFVFIGPILKLLAPSAATPGTITLRSTATMRKE